MIENWRTSLRFMAHLRSVIRVVARGRRGRREPQALGRRFQPIAVEAKSSTQSATRRDRITPPIVSVSTSHGPETAFYLDRLYANTLPRATLVGIRQLALP
jgi:hypothetical protein